MLFKVYKTRVWVLLFMLLPFLGNAQIPGLPSGWEFTLNPTSGIYAVPTSVLFDNVEPLEPGDWIGAFYDDNGVMECGGAVQWDGTDNVAVVVFGNDTLVAPDKNGFSEGEYINWKFYRTAEGEEEDVMSDPEFNWMNGAGEAVNAFIGIGPEPCVQELNLSPGWNWISFNVLPEAGADINNVLGTDGYAAGDFIQTVGGTADFFEGFGWFGTLSQIDPDKMYQIKLGSSKELTITGICVDVSDPITVSSGWNWIGYKPTAASDINIALATLPSVGGDFIQTAGGTADYFEGFGWFGTLAQLQPGKGYQIKQSNSGELIYPEVESIGATAVNSSEKIFQTDKETKENPGWPTPPVFPNYQTVTYQVLLNGEPVEVAGSQLSAWKDDEIRGLVSLLMPPPIPGALPHYPLQMGSELTAEPGFTFQFYHAGTDMVYQVVETHDFEALNNQGSIFAPVQLNLIAEETIDICGTVINSVTLEPIAGATVTATSGGGGTPGNPNWPTPAVFPNYQTVTYQVFMDGNPLEVSGSQLSAWKDGEIRGLVSLLMPPPIPGALPHYPLQMGSELTSEAGFTFKFYDAASDMVYDIAETHDFVALNNQGSIFFPIPLTVVAGSGETYEATTLADGTYCLLDVMEGTYTITAEADGYLPQEFEDVLVEESITQDFQLEPIITCEDAVIIGFPEAVQGVCAGEAVEFIDFVEVTVENAVNTVWTIDPADAGSLDESYVFTLNPDFAGGLVTISLLAEAEEGCEDAYAEVSFDIFPLPVFDCPEDIMVCQDTEPIEFTAMGEYFYEGEQIFGWNPDVAGTFEILYVYTDPATGCSDDCVFTIEVYPTPVVECPEFEPVCEGSDFIAFDLELGTYYDATGEPVEGFDPVEFGFYTFTLEVIDENGCVGTCEFTIEVNMLPEVILEAFEPVCEGSEAFDLFGGMPEGGIYFVDGVETTSFDPAMAGLYTVLYVYTDENGCSNEAEGSILVNELPQVILEAFEPVCEGSEAFDLFGGMPEGGAYFVNGEEAVSFDPAMAGSYEILYVYTDENGCTNEASGTIVVNPVPVAECPEFEPVCAGSDFIEFDTELGMYYDATGEPVEGFDPAEGGEFVFTLVVENEFGCTDQCDFVITVYDLPEVTCPGDVTLLLADLPYTLMGAMPEGGTYSGFGVTDGVFEVSELGDYVITYTYTDIETGCTDVCEFMIYVVDEECPNPAMADAGADVEVCADGSTVQLEGMAQNFSSFFWSTLTGTGDFDDPNSLAAIYTPGPADYLAGSVELCLTVIGLPGCDDAVDCMTITFNPIPEVVCEDYVVCEGEMIEFPMVEGGVYTDAAGEPVMGFEAEMAGTYEFMLTVTNDFGCSASCDFVVVVNPLPSIEVELSATEVCFGGSITATVSGPEDGAYPYMVTYSINGEQFEIEMPSANESLVFDEGEPGTYVGELISIVDANGCMAMVNEIFTVVVNPLPSIEVELSATEICFGETLVAAITGPADGAYPYMVTFTVSGLPYQYELTESFGELSLMGFPVGTYEAVLLSIEDANGCMAMPNEVFTFDVNPLPEVECPVIEPVCEGSDYVMFPEVEMGVYTDMDGNVVDGLDPMMAGTYMFTLTVTNEFGCEASCEFEVVVNPLPVVECPEIASVCEGSDYVMFPEVEMGVYTDMDGNVVDGFDPMMAGTYMFSLTVSNEFGCEATCEFEVVVNPLPYIELSLSAEVICLGDEVIGTITGPADGAYPYMVEYSINGEVMTDEIVGTPLEIPLVPDMAGLYTLEVLSIVDANGCVAMPVEGVELTVLPLTEIVEQPVSLEVPYGAPAMFSVVAENATTYEWYFGGEVVGTEAEYMIEAVDLEDDGEYYVVVIGECGEVTSETVTLTVLPLTQTIPFMGSVNGMSTFLDLVDADLATIFGDILGDLQQVEFRNPNIIWTPLNASFDFNEAKGAKVLMLPSGIGSEIEVAGYPTLGLTLDLPAGISFMPVWSQTTVSAADVFEPLGSSLSAVFSMDYSGIYWPDFNYFTLHNLVPGSAYLVVMNSAATVNFDVPAVNAMVPSFVDIPANVTTWEDAKLTGIQHNIAISSNALSQLEVGDVIGAFNEYGQITGMVEVTSLRDNTVLRAFGDNYATEATEGFVEGDMISIKVWRDGQEIPVDVIFDQDMPNTNIFAQDGMSAITNMSTIMTSVEELTAELEASVFPNPATDIANIQANFEIRNLRVVNYVGQVVVDQRVNENTFQINTANLGSGLYFVQLETSEGVVITKRLTIK